MSRSYRKHNIIPNAICFSERWDKQNWHRKFRSKIKQICSFRKNDDELTANDFPKEKEVSNDWNFLKDGKSYICKKTIMDDESFYMHHTKDGKLYK